MARMRTLKPEFWTDEELACQLTRDERFLYIGLWNLADEHSRLRGDPRYIKGQLFPYDDDITPDCIEKMLGNLEALGKVWPYRVGPGRYLFLPNLERHQRLEDKVPSRLPSPDQDESGATFPESYANKNARDADELASDPDEDALLYVAGSREHVAGSRGTSVAKPPRPDVERLCAHLADRIEGNGSKRPEIGQKWRDAARLMLDRDGRTEQQVLAAIDWCQNDGFWKSNVMSMATLREKYDRLRLQAEEQRNRASPNGNGKHPPVDRAQQATDAKFDRAMERARAREAAAE